MMPPTDAAEAWARRNARVDELAGAHFVTPPEYDPRTWLQLSQRGVLARGHTPGRCCACEAPASPTTRARVREDRTITPMVRARRPAPSVAPAVGHPGVSPWVAAPSCAVAGCEAPRAGSIPTTHALLTELCAPHRALARNTLRKSRATHETLLAYLDEAEARAAVRSAASRDGTSVREAVLLALVSLGDRPVTLSTLVVRAWEREPSRFGLTGHADRYPDSNRVLAKLSGDDGIVVQGWCERTAIGVLVLTAKGRRHAATLATGGAR